MLSDKVREEMKWHKENLRTAVQDKINGCTEALEKGALEGVYVMTPPTDEEHEAYFLAKINVYFDIWASTWS